MAKQRIVNTKFWDDKYIRSLDPNGKLLFIYLFTNSLATIAGAYEIDVDRMRFDTKISLGKIESLLEKFRQDGKAEYRDGWAVMINTIEHQTTVNPKIKRGIEESLKCCPDWIKHRLSIRYDWLSHLNLNTNSNSNSNLNANAKTESGVLPASVDSAEKAIFVGTVLTELPKAMNLKKLPSERDWIRVAEDAFDNSFLVSDFLECHALLRKQKWRTGAITCKTVSDNLPELNKLREDVRSQESGSDKKPNTTKRTDAEVRQQSEAFIKQKFGIS